MIPAAFAYHRPRTLQAALRQLQTLGGDAKVMAGGQSLLPMMKLRVAVPPHVIDISRIAALRRIRAREGRLHIGALATHYMVESTAAVRRAAPALAEAAASIGDLQVRNLGTIGGSVMHADPAADYPAVLLALGAEVVLESPRGTRTVPIDGSFQGLMATAASPDEVLTEVIVPPLPPRSGTAYLKVANPASGFALAGVAAAVTLDADDRCTQVRIGVTGVASVAYRARKMEQSLTGRDLVDDVLKTAASAAADGVDVNADIFASADYRRHLARVLTARAVSAARERARGRKR
jgi:carbon-monoxide dehydrogenase medium subunit